MSTKSSPVRSTVSPQKVSRAWTQEAGFATPDQLVDLAESRISFNLQGSYREKLVRATRDLTSFRAGLIEQNREIDNADARADELLNLCHAVDPLVEKISRITGAEDILSSPAEDADRRVSRHNKILAGMRNMATMMNALLAAYELARLEYDTLTDIYSHEIVDKPGDVFKEHRTHTIADHIAFLSGEEPEWNDDPVAEEEEPDPPSGEIQLRQVSGLTDGMQ